MIITRELLLKYLGKTNIKIEPVKLSSVCLLKERNTVVGELGTTYFRWGNNYYNFGNDIGEDPIVLNIIRMKGLTAFL